MNTRNINFIYFLPVVGIGFAGLCYFWADQVSPIDTVYLSMSIFLFATLSGFFISRQAGRYSQITTLVAEFDGIMSSLYRSSQLVSDQVQKKTADIITEHYNLIIKAESWDAYFNQKTNTITNITNLVHDIQEEYPEPTELQKQFLGRLGYGSINDLQKIRKKMIVLYQERIPNFQWMLMDFLAFILLVAVYAIPTEGLLFPAVVKGAFAAVIVAVLVLIRRLNNLTLFEDMAGQRSAQDVLSIVEGTR